MFFVVDGWLCFACVPLTRVVKMSLTRSGAVRREAPILGNSKETGKRDSNNQESKARGDSTAMQVVKPSSHISEPQAGQVGLRVDKLAK